MQVELGDGQVHAALPGRQGRLLFAYLLLERERGASRDELAALLWPERPPPAAGITLRALLSKLRSVLGPGAVSGTRELRIDLGDDVWVDVEAAFSAAAQADRAIDRGALREAANAAQVVLSIASQQLLPGDDGDWIEEKRRELEDLRLVALEQLGTVALEVGGSELGTAERAARRLIEAAPYRENGYLLLMRALTARGNPAEAILVYDRARTLLSDELGIAPAPELRALNDKLLRSSPDADASVAASPKGGVALPPLLAGAERTPMFGRADERAGLIARFDDAMTSGPLAATVTGEAGIGKTRFVAELARQVHARGVLVLYGAATREPSPYEAILDALRPCIDQASSKLLASLRLIDPPVIARLLPELHETDEPRPPELGLDDASGRLRALVALTRVIGTLVDQGPLLLVLDDMQWADTASTQFLGHLLRTSRPGPILVVLAHRTGEAPPALRDVLQQADRRMPIERIELSALTEEDVAALITAWAGTGVPAAFARDLHIRTDGNPFFIANLLRHLVAAGAIDPSIRRWASAAEILAIGVPREVRELIELRMVPFGEHGRAVLGAAAVIGQEFTLAMVEETLRDGALDTLDLALRAGLISEDPSPAGGFRFAHALIREAVYVGLSSARRARLHLAAGRALEALSTNDGVLNHAALARHYLIAARAGEDAMPAIEHSLAAALHARQLFGNDDAERHYRIALDLLQHRTEPSLHAIASEGLGDVLAVRAHYVDALSAYTQATDATPDGCSEDRARLRRKIGHVYIRARKPHEATEAFNAAEIELRTPQDPAAAIAEAIEIGLDRLTLLYWQGNTDGMRRVIEQLRPRVDAHGTPVQRVRLLHSMLARDMRVRRYVLTRTTVDLAQAALAAAEQTNDPAVTATARFQLGFTLTWSGQPDDGARSLEQAQEFAARSGDLTFQARVLAYLAVAHRKRVSVTDTDRSARQALDAAAAAGMPEYVAIAHANLAWVTVQEGHISKARDYAEFAREQIAELPFHLPPYLPLALWPLLAAALAEGDPDGAATYARQLLDPANRPPSRRGAKLLRDGIDAQPRDRSRAAREFLSALELEDGIRLTNVATELVS